MITINVQTHGEPVTVNGKFIQGQGQGFFTLKFITNDGTVAIFANDKQDLIALRDSVIGAVDDAIMQSLNILGEVSQQKVDNRSSKEVFAALVGEHQD